MATITLAQVNLKRLIPFVTALSLTLLLTQGFPQTSAHLADRIGDQVWRWVADHSALEQRVVVVDIDEVSIARYGTWPWPRTRLAELTEIIAAQGATLQIFDMVFAEQKSEDSRLIEQLRQHNTVLAQILAINADDKTRMGVLAGNLPDKNCQADDPQANAYIGNTPAIAQAANAIGHITPHIDPDGVVRRIPSFICYQNQRYPALALAVLASAMQQPVNFQTQVSEGLWQPHHHLVNPAIPELSIPVDRQGDMLLPWWLARQSIVSVSATDLLEQQIPSRVLDGAWVIIGSTAFGSGDAVPTPLAGLVGGVEVHAQLLSALLNHSIPYTPKSATLIIWIGYLIMALTFLALYQLKGRLIIYSPLLLALTHIVLAIIWQIVWLKTTYLWLPVLPWLIFALLSGIFMAIDGYSLTWANNQTLYRNLTSYLPAQAARWVADQDPVDSLDAHHEQLLIMYVDLRNFSNWCNHLPPEQIGAILHTFYKEVSRVVARYGGETEKYVGDAVMVVWRNTDLSALNAAQELLQLTESRFGEDNLDSAQLPPLAIGIGMEYGNVLVGSFGPAQRREYTVIGKTVTVAIRLQEMCEELAWPILIGETAAAHWQDRTELETQGQFLLPGSPNPIEIFVPKLA
jgi:adenylate cyclase